MPNWVSTRILAFPTKENEDCFQKLMDDIEVKEGEDQVRPIYYLEALGNSYKTFFAEDPICFREKKMVSFHLHSGWILPYAFMESLISCYRARIIFIFSDETEDEYDIDYSSPKWPFTTGSAGVGFWEYGDDEECHFFPPKTTKDSHEMFLMAWDWERPVDGGRPDFFNQNNLSDHYFMVSSSCNEEFDLEDSPFYGLPALQEWLTTRLKDESK